MNRPGPPLRYPRRCRAACLETVSRRSQLERQIAISSGGTSLPGRLQRHNIFYGWIVVAVCFVIISLIFAVRLSFGLFFDTLTRSSEFDWTRADTAGVFSLTMIVFAATSTISGHFLDKWGPRRIFAAGLLIIASGLALTSRMTNLAHFYIAYGLWTGLGITVLGLTMQAATLSRWFDRLGRRGLAIGIAFSGTGFGILLMAPIIERVMSRTDWRTAYMMLAGLLLVIGMPLVWFLLHDDPRSIGLLPDGLQRHAPQRTDGTQQLPAAPRAAAPTRAWTFGRAMQTVTFWLLMLSGALSLFTLRMISVHQIAHLVDQSITRMTAANVLGSAGLVTAIAFILFGSLSDRIGRARSFYFGTIAQILALLLLLAAAANLPAYLLYLYALCWGIGEGSRSGLLTALAGDIFSGPALGAIVGTMGAFFGLGAALGSWLGGFAYDQMGSYDMAFWSAIAATILATVCVAVIRRIAATG